MKPYIHKVKYYETDRMGITHHSNYVRWMEDARLFFLEQIGWGLDKIEESGIVGPVVSVKCHYIKTTTFAENITIYVTLEEVRGARLRLSYVMKNAAGEIVAEGKSENCFTDSEGRVLRLDRKMPEFYEALMNIKED